MHKNFSKSSIHSAVLKKSFTLPSLLYPATMSVLATAGFFTLGGSSIALGLAAVGGLVAGGSWVKNYLLDYDNLAAEYVRKMHERMQDSREELVIQLREELSKLEHERGLAQLDMLNEKYLRLQELLASKLDTSELAYQRYLAMAEQVFLSALDNLLELVSRYKSIQTIRVEYIDKRKEELEIDGIVVSERAEYKSLQTREAIYDKQKVLIEGLLAKNEEAMTEIDKTTVAISGMITKRGNAQLDLETAMQELSTLADRADEYSMRKL